MDTFHITLRKTRGALKQDTATNHGDESSSTELDNHKVAINISPAYATLPSSSSCLSPDPLLTLPSLTCN